MPRRRPCRPCWGRRQQRRRTARSCPAPTAAGGCPPLPWPRQCGRPAARAAWPMVPSPCCREGDVQALRPCARALVAAERSKDRPIPSLGGGCLPGLCRSQSAQGNATTRRWRVQEEKTAAFYPPPKKWSPSNKPEQAHSQCQTAYGSLSEQFESVSDAHRPLRGADAALRCNIQMPLRPDASACCLPHSCLQGCKGW